MEESTEGHRASQSFLEILSSTWGVYVIGGLTEAYRTDFLAIPEIPSLGGAYPFLGHLPWLGGRLKLNDATLFTQWGRQLNTDFFQIKLGHQRCLVVNSWAKMKDFWVDRNTSVMDRPLHAEFLDFVGIDISGSSWSEQLKKCRTAGVKALGKPMWPSYYNLMEPNATKLIKDMYEQGENGKVAMEMFPWLRQMVTDLTLYLTYGARAGDFDNDLTNTLLQSIADVTSVRGSTSAYRQYVPWLRWRKVKMSKVIDAVARRRVCIDKLYNQYLDKVANGENPTCIVSSLSADKLNLDEIHGTCVSLLQAAPETVASGIYQCCAWLCTPENQDVQKEALAAILETYDGDRDQAWKMAFREEKVALITSLYKETLRFYTPSPYAGRRVSQPINYNGIQIPQGVEIMLNIQSINHDVDHYGPTATSFNPRRFIDDTTPLPHLSYGTGARICPAYQISNRIMYATLVRMLLAFEMKQVEGTRLPSTHMINFSDGYGLVAHPRRYDCGFVARDPVWLRKILSE